MSRGECRSDASNCLCTCAATACAAMAMPWGVVCVVESTSESPIDAAVYAILGGLCNLGVILSAKVTR